MFKHLLLSLALVFAAPLFAADGGKSFSAGEHYDLITPAIRTANPDKIEVTEFFWYGCGHCYNFEPVISQWKKSLADDVEFKGSPAVWAAQMELHSKAFYTAEVLGVSETMHLALFQAMNVDKKRLASEAEIASLFVANGVAEADFVKAFNSFGVGSMVRQATSRAKAAKITGTPEIMVNGKYRVTTRRAGSQAKMLEIANFLIEKERAAKGG
ncbi:MAG: thiol:disulfide interchange protein DsbA/DsbL [Gammaproteobacteria bacterium]|nr:MAG: thiol:disulfide interchange protein DsbA/DsbL [Gammaproteobacteria bacterium]